MPHRPIPSSNEPKPPTPEQEDECFRLTLKDAAKDRETMRRRMAEASASGAGTEI